MVLFCHHSIGFAYRFFLFHHFSTPILLSFFRTNKTEKEVDNERKQCKLFHSLNVLLNIKKKTVFHHLSPYINKGTGFNTWKKSKIFNCFFGKSTTLNKFLLSLHRINNLLWIKRVSSIELLIYTMMVSKIWHWVKPCGLSLLSNSSLCLRY